MSSLQHNLSPEQVAQAKAQFEKYDADKSGDIDMSELKKCLEQTLHTKLSDKLYEKYVQAQFSLTDKNEDKKIQFEEFLVLYDKLYKSKELPIGFGNAPQGKAFSAPSASISADQYQGKKFSGIPKDVKLTEEETQEARRLFEKYDADKSGSIEKSELAEILKETNQAKKMSKMMFDRLVNMHMSSADKDGSGTIEFNEFLKIYSNIFKQSGPVGGAQLPIVM